MSGAVARLKRRRDYLRVAAARRKAVLPGMVVQALERDSDDSDVRAGFTASRKVGNAVRRNKARRRLKALADELLPSQGTPATDYVLIARHTTVERDFADLRDDLEKALQRLSTKREART
ncbi:MAG: ribonuclease P protein component [Rhodospirillaceae bacterium]|jgi:ribonuclease P protein component|nr:ribonuclease P protein component [Rhodospirillaceae bacterium]MBT6509138.1 ribonuclease P protein component [Rhodospirillaceae bacterium]MBT7612657.1 ribonuclease P protein component [Rhodospirillaceae bacterium]MBT7646379.1 ribonuclease P protein component [Rhodospirillaceae bacterium]